MRVLLEIGPKRKKVVAVAPDWPGLARGSATEEAAIERLRSYVPRYAAVARLAGMEAAFAAIATADVVERYEGTGSAGFWGISFAFSGIDQQPMSSDALERELTLMRACWSFFDAVRACRLRCSEGRAAEGAIGITSSAIRLLRNRVGRRSLACSRLRMRCRPTRD
jgi:hypothetical protein